MKYRIWLSRPYIFGNEIEFLKESIDSNWISTVGGKLNELEELFRQKLNYHGSVNLLNTGTSALHIALLKANIQPEEYVLCSSLTFIAGANTIKYCGAKPIFIDSENDTFNVCPILLEESIDELKKKGIFPKALILVHFCGIPAKINEIAAICAKNNIILIEDSAGAFGSKSKDKYLGTIGDFGIISTNGNKIITGGAGGILLSKSLSNQNEIKNLITQSKDHTDSYNHINIGYNYGMSNLNAAVIRAQLQHFEFIQIRKEEIFNYYQNNLSFLRFPVVEETDFFNKWLVSVVFPSTELREKVYQALKSNQIESRYFWKPMHRQPLYNNEISFINGVSDDLSKTGLNLPSDINMSEQELFEVCQIIQSQL